MCFKTPSEYMDSTELCIYCFFLFNFCIRESSRDEEEWENVGGHIDEETVKTVPDWELTQKYWCSSTFQKEV